MTYGLNGKVALIAGASKGIGAATALAFAREGASVAIGARNLEQLKQVASRIEAAGGKALAVELDVGDATSVEQFVQKTVDRFGRLDFGFNNATDGPKPALLADVDPEQFDVGIRANIRGTFLGMKYQVKAMLQSGGGSIVNMASVAGMRGFATLGTYVAGKAGIIGLTKCAALDYADQGIRVNVVAPGPILTHHLAAAGEQAQKGAALATPMQRVGRVEEVASVVLWLCSESSSFVTGSVIPIDGGQFAGLKPPTVYRQGEGMQQVNRS